MSDSSSAASIPSGKPLSSQSDFDTLLAGALASSAAIGYSPEVRSVLEQAARQITDRGGEWEKRFLAESRALSEDAAAPTICEEEPLFPALVFLSVAPALWERHRARGIGDAIIRDSLVGLEVWLRDYYGKKGVWGLGNVNWPVTYFSGRLFALGRLQFEIRENMVGYLLPEEIALGEGDRLLAVHIPAIGKLDDSDCEASFRAAREFFPRYFPEYRFPAMTCASWMMNRELERALPPEANLAKFVKRFEPLQRTEDNDGQVWQRVFGLEGGQPDDLDALPCTSSLQRVVLDLAKRGERWWTSGGLIRL